MKPPGVGSLVPLLTTPRTYPQQKLLGVKPRVSGNGLRISRVNRDATSDETLVDLQPVVHTQLPERPLRDIEGC